MPSTTRLHTPPQCSVARSLEVLGEKWTLLIVRDAAAGRTRFSEFLEHLGVSSDILTDRLATLVSAGVLERRAYREAGSRERSSYHLTESGRELHTVLAAFAAWGDRYRPAEEGPLTMYRSIESKEPVSVRFLTVAGETLSAEQVESVRLR